jgi:hypothetical protein
MSIGKIRIEGLNSQLDARELGYRMVHEKQ